MAFCPYFVVGGRKVVSQLSAPTKDQVKQRGFVQRFFANLGPGLVTGATDDDPSGISTYSVAGTVFGYSLLWTALVSLPLMAAVQLMCARLGMVTGRGLGGRFDCAIRRGYYGRLACSWLSRTCSILARI
jgi:Mn2+/Fe2+ NRAMP family transporter